MKSIWLFSAIACAVTGCQSGVRIADQSDLKANVDRFVVLTGRYHDPGKGERGLDCGFAWFPISDYSLYSTDKEGYLHLLPLIEEGARIEVRALLRFFPESRIPVEEEGMMQTVAGKIEVIDGRSYDVHPSSYSIVKVRLIRLVEIEPNQPTETTRGK